MPKRTSSKLMAGRKITDWQSGTRENSSGSTNGSGISTSLTDQIAELNYPETALNTPFQNQFNCKTVVIADMTIPVTIPVGAWPYLTYSHEAAADRSVNWVWFEVAGTFTYCQFDPATGLASNWAQLGGIALESCHWSRKADGAGKLWFMDSTRRVLKRRNFNTGTVEVSIDLGSRMAGSSSGLFQMFMSDDDNVFSWTYRPDGATESHYAIYIRSTDTFLTGLPVASVYGVNEAHVDRSGDWVHISGQDAYVDIVKVATNSVLYSGWRGANPDIEMPFGHNDSGFRTIIGRDNNNGSIWKVNLAALDDSPTAFRNSRVQLTFNADRQLEGHVNCNFGNDWALVGQYAYDIIETPTNVPPADPMRNEIFWLKTNITNSADRGVKRFAKSMNTSPTIGNVPYPSAAPVAIGGQVWSFHNTDRYGHKIVAVQTPVPV